MATCAIPAYPREPKYQLAAPFTVSPLRSWAQNLEGRDAARTTRSGRAVAAAVGVGVGEGVGAVAGDGVGAGDGLGVGVGLGAGEGSSVEASSALWMMLAGVGAVVAASTEVAGLEVTMSVSMAATTAARQRRVVGSRTECLVRSRPALGGGDWLSRPGGMGPCRAGVLPGWVGRVDASFGPGGAEF